MDAFRIRFDSPYGVTQQHGDSITVDSKVDECSEFTIRLPRDR
jgi:signal transduction histidine kinase